MIDNFLNVFSLCHFVYSKDNFMYSQIFKPIYHTHIYRYNNMTHCIIIISITTIIVIITTIIIIVTTFSSIKPTGPTGLQTLLMERLWLASPHQPPTITILSPKKKPTITIFNPNFPSINSLPSPYGQNISSKV